MASDGRRGWGATALATALAVVFLQLSVLGIFFLLPLQWLYRRRGASLFLVAALATALGTGAVEVVVLTLSHSSWSLLDTAKMGVPLLLIAGWVLIVLLEKSGWRFLYRLLGVTAVTAALLFVVIGQAAAQPDFGQKLEGAFNQVWNQALQTSGLGAQDAFGQVEKKALFELIKETFLGSFVLVFFLFWGFTEWLSRAFTPARWARTWRDFSVPTQGVWLLLGFWGVILLQAVAVRFGAKWDLGFAQYVVLNAAWVALAVYAMEGWGIVQALMERWNWPRFVQAVVRTTLVVFVLMPGPTQIVVMIGLPVLAVLELWVNFRKREQGVRE